MKPHHIYTDYLITEEGDVYSRKYGELKKRKQCTDNLGYKRIILYNDGKPKTHKVHRLVAETYIPNPDNLPEVNHIDEDKTNNNISNLEWCTRTYNIQYTHAKTYIVENVRTGERQTIFNLRAFCRDNQLSNGALHNTFIRGKPYKGYKLIERIERTN